MEGPGAAAARDGAALCRGGHSCRAQRTDGRRDRLGWTVGGA
ncbi:hypothetical protein [Xylella fastidiosa]|nr:hypothetical protein [Xylella fastidiosa]